MKRLTLYLLIAIILLSACSPSKPTPEQTTNDPLGMEDAMPIEITSSAFTHEAAIPAKYTCRGENISPALSWGEPPAGTQSFAIIMDDPDAPNGTWVHWVLFNIPVSARSLPEAFPSDTTLPDGSLSGNSSFGSPGYGGPCPPSGTHRYFFKLYALDEMLAISAGATKGELEKAMVGHILAQGELMGTFSK
ncbi:MAG TPA: YbhB/YbcL family Raf kinase inhibitor-like protein [Anaerolineales bacterium]|nr:YbhB/YbcL family Raf kinase inhibitor-like protein [Anaerolineales bacterium]